MADASEREDLEALIASPGWLRFLQYTKETWSGDGYARKIKLAISQAREKHEDVAAAVQRVDAANDEINAVMSWPQHRARTLLEDERRARLVAPMGRRGAL